MTRRTRLRKAAEAEAAMASKTEEEIANNPTDESPPQGKEIRNFTGDSSGLKEHLKGYEAVTKNVLINFRELAMASNADGELSDSPPQSGSKKKTLKSGHLTRKFGSAGKKRSKRSATKGEKQKNIVVEEYQDEEKDIDEDEDPVEDATDDDDDLTLKLKGNMSKLPELVSRPEGTEDTPVLLTNPENQAVEALRKCVPDLTDRDVTLFLYGYRLKGDHNVKTMQTLLQSMSQCATVLASQNRNIKHTANTLSEGLRGAKRSLSIKPEKLPADKKTKTKEKEDTKGNDIMLDSIEPILSYAGKTPEDIFTLYDLSVSQIYDALKYVIRDVSQHNYDFLDDSNWPHNLFDLFQEKKMEITKNVGTSKVGAKKKKN